MVNIYQYHSLRGNFSTRDVWLDGKKLSPKRSQKVRNHSPDGFNWGYGGSGPAQLALAIILKLTGTSKHYQPFKWKFIANLPKDNFDTRFSLFFVLGADANDYNQDEQKPEP